MPVEFRELLLKFINKTIHPVSVTADLIGRFIDGTPRDQWTIQGMRPLTRQRRESAGSGKTGHQANAQRSADEKATRVEPRR
jgi:hypothetical protein